MRLKDNSTDKLVKMSVDVHDEITRDLIDTFGIDLTEKSLVYHDKTKPAWTQQIQDNKSLKQELDSFLNIVKNNVERLPEMVKFEQEHPSAIGEDYSRDSISYDLEFLWICESHLDKFEKEKYLAQKDINNYRAKIWDLKNKIKDITVNQSLL